MIPFEHMLALSFTLFALAAAGFLTSRNVIVILMFAELMLNAANIALIAFSRLGAQAHAQILVFMILAVAAAEAGIGLAIVIMLARAMRTLDISEIRNLRG